MAISLIPFLPAMKLDIEKAFVQPLAKKLYGISLAGRGTCRVIKTSGPPAGLN
jgi:hypothetical protein